LGQAGLFISKEKRHQPKRRDRDLMAGPSILFDTEHAKSILGTERRAYVRFANTPDTSGHSTITTSIKDEAETAWLGTIRDVSAAGIALNVSRRFEPGTALIVELSAQSKGVLRLPVRVVHSTPDEKGRWVIGCAFVVPHSSERDRLPYRPSAS
jgi:hypothetical protein